MTGQETSVRPADRFVEAQLWWVASELCRRHPELRLVEREVDGLGTIVEAVSPPKGGEQIRIGFSRVAGIMIVGGEERLGTGDLFAEADAHAHVKRLEAATGVGSPRHAPPTTPLASGYRFISYVLNSMINSRFSWTVRGERWTDPHVCRDVSWLGGAEEWPSMIELRKKWRAIADGGDLYAKFPCQGWLIMRDLEPVAFADTFGMVHRGHGRLEMAQELRHMGSIELIDYRCRPTASGSPAQ